jgi:hypothetical protein
LEPEKALMLAVLEDAVTCIQKSNRWFRETIVWILTEDDDGLFSFDSICEALDLDASSLRRALIDTATKTPVRQDRAFSGEYIRSPEEPASRKNLLSRPVSRWR